MGHVVCDEGYEVWIRNVHAIAYRDGVDSVEVFAEPLVGAGVSLAVRRDDIPAVSWLTREELIDRLARAFAYAGWTLIVD